MIKSKPDWITIVLVVIMPALIIFIMIAVESKKSETTAAEPVYVGTFHTICLDGVLYWDQYRRLAVYIDKETLTPKRCEVAE